MSILHLHWRSLVVTVIALVATIVASACNVNTALEEVLEARHLSSDLQVQFTKAADDSNLAVMADTDEASAAFANDAKQRTAAAQKDADAMRPLLETLRFTEELTLLDQFRSRFSEYQKIDARILELAVENTNLKAQRLSFGTSQDAVDALSKSLQELESTDDSKDSWRGRALAARVVAHAREIQALQAPHIAEPDDGAMSKIEQRMSAAELAARADLKTLAASVPPNLRPKVVATTTELDRLMKANRQVIGLSRRNTNVRSLALALNQKRAAVAECEEPLHALQQALAKRAYVGTRYSVR
jgi:hypothetical protein